MTLLGPLSVVSKNTANAAPRTFIQTVAVSVNDIKLPVGFESFHQPAVVYFFGRPWRRLQCLWKKNLGDIHHSRRRRGWWVHLFSGGKALQLGDASAEGTHVQYPLGCFFFSFIWILGQKDKMHSVKKKFMPDTILLVPWETWTRQEVVKCSGEKRKIKKFANVHHDLIINCCILHCFLLFCFMFSFAQQLVNIRYICNANRRW